MLTLADGGAGSIRMKKLIILIAAFGILLSMLVYQAVMLSMPKAEPEKITDIKEEPEKITDIVVEEKGILWLVLPISNQKVNIDGEQHYLDKIDLSMLRAAEEKLLDRMDDYTLENDAYFWLSSHDGQINLCMELIISLDPPSYPTDPSYTGPTVPQEGCGIDHDHLLFSEPISNP